MHINAQQNWLIRGAANHHFLPHSAASENGNEMLSKYHTRAYGLQSKGQWSCCSISQRPSKGCETCVCKYRQSVTLSINHHCKLYMWSFSIFIVSEKEIRSHTLQMQGTQRNAAMEVAAQCRSISYPWQVSDSPPPPLPEPSFLLELPRARCYSHEAQTESPRV